MCARSVSGGYFFSQTPESKNQRFPICKQPVDQFAQAVSRARLIVLFIRNGTALHQHRASICPPAGCQELSANGVWEMHKADRAGRHIQPVCFSAFKKLLNGTTHQGGPEARGRKRKLGVRAVRALDAKRRQLVDRTNGEIEITWADIIKKAHITSVHPTTTRRSLLHAP